MANPTTNYGFVLPTSSDLVTDLPADFDIALQGVDTRLKALQPGTTLGDLAYSSATANTNTRLGIGSTGQVLTVASGVPTWATPSAGSSNVAGKNGVLNSAFNVWQRGTSIAGSGSAYNYTADRWQTNASTALTVSRQATGDTTNLPFIQYCARVQRNNGSTATAAAVLAQSFETVNSIPYAGKTVTISFYARRGANFSGASNQLEIYLATGTGTDQNVFVGGYTGATNAIYQTPTLTTTWQRFSYSATLATTATELGVQFTYTPSGTAGAADFYEVTGVQLEIASSASAYSPATATYQTELAACQRYYYLQSAYATTGATTLVANGYYYSSTQYECVVNFPVTMRTAPTMVATTGTNYYNTRESSPAQISTLLFTRAATNTGLIYATVSGKTAGYALSLEIVNAAGSIAFSSEL